VFARRGTSFLGSRFANSLVCVGLWLRVAGAGVLDFERVGLGTKQGVLSTTVISL
jgi:hypothetical protein